MEYINGELYELVDNYIAYVEHLGAPAKMSVVVSGSSFTDMDEVSRMVRYATSKGYAVLLSAGRDQTPEFTLTILPLTDVTITTTE